jgi:hypothetical protein
MARVRLSSHRAKPDLEIWAHQATQCAVFRRRKLAVEANKNQRALVTSYVGYSC